MQDFRKLLVWQRAHALTLAVYRATERSPREHQWGLTSQMRRSSESIPENIAEGCGLGGDRGFRRHLRIAMGSACELEYQLLLAHDLTLVADHEHEELAGQVTETKKMLAALIRRLTEDTRSSGASG